MLSLTGGIRQLTHLYVENKKAKKITLNSAGFIPRAPGLPCWSGGWWQPPRVGGVRRWGHPPRRSPLASGLSLEFQFWCRNTRARAAHSQGERNPRTQIWTSFPSFSVVGELADVHRRLLHTESRPFQPGLPTHRVFNSSRYKVYPTQH